MISFADATCMELFKLLFNSNGSLNDNEMAIKTYF